MIIDRRTFVLGSSAALGACVTPPAPDAPDFVEIWDPRAHAYFLSGARLELLGSGYGWSEGPTWDWDRQALYFSDVPGNIAYRWKRGEGVSTFLNPSGRGDAEGFREPGSNGLLYEGNGQLLICNHGERRVERLDLSSGSRTGLAHQFGGRRFSSPNDVAKARDGSLFFTDPPYGLAEGDASPLKEQDANGVYRLGPDGSVQRLLSHLDRPNGVGLSPDGRTLYVTQSLPERPILQALTLSPNGAPSNVRTLTDFSPVMGEDDPGLPDGMTVAASGEILIGGPGGVLIVAPTGERLARIRCGSAAANCSFGEDGRTLFITAHDRLLRLEMNLQGLAPA